MRETEVCFSKVNKYYLNFLKKEKISNHLFNKNLKILKKIFIPLCFWINKKKEKMKGTLILGLSGGQGSGKSTISKILKIILEHFFKNKVCILSIDDFYKTLKDRRQLALTKHELLKTRGVPGTHDIKFIEDFFKLLKRKIYKKTKLPKFDKSIDDRYKKKYWLKIKKKPDIVILEGWCVGAKPQKNSVLNIPKNSLERNEDNELIWRNYVNKKLKTSYKKLFNSINYFIFMKVPNFKMVFKWRLLQEKKLRNKSRSRKKIMSYKEIKRFIMFYERITLQMIKDLSKSSSVVMFLKNNHEINKIIFRS